MLDSMLMQITLLSYLSGCLISAAAAFSQSTKQPIWTTQPPLLSPSFNLCSDCDGKPRLLSISSSLLAVVEEDALVSDDKVASASMSASAMLPSGESASCPDGLPLATEEGPGGLVGPSMCCVYCMQTKKGLLRLPVAQEVSMHRLALRTQDATSCER